MSIFTPDTHGLQTFEAKGKFLMAWRFSLAFSVLFLAMSVLIYSYTPEGGILYLIIGSISVSILIFLHKTKKYAPVFILYAICGSVISQYSLNFIHEVTHFADLLWIFLVCVFAFISINKLWGWLLVLANLLGVGYFVFFQMNNHILIVQPHDMTERTTVFIELILGFLILAYLVNQYVVLQNYSRLQQRKLNYNLEQQNQTVINRNKENVTLIKEVHHRVKNNLQIIISLLRMQRSEIESEENQEQFTIAINRVMTMSMIHQKLYQEKEPSRINIPEYISDLANELLSVSNKQVNLSMDAEEEYAGLKTIVPFGLLVNELISNSLKHAFPENENAQIQIKIHKSGEQELIFKYKDNGNWVEPKQGVSSFGLELIDVLTEQLDGSYTREASQYTFTIDTMED